jgi:hypothetical protein
VAYGGLGEAALKMAPSWRLAAESAVLLRSVPAADPATPAGDAV